MAGCALAPPPTSEELQKEVLTHTTLPPAFRGGDGVAAPVADRWLAAFDDPALTALVVEALAYNADLRVSAARVEQAAGYVKVANASLLPSVGVFATGGGKSGGGGGLDGIWLNASLELDVWGRVRYGGAAAEAAIRSRCRRLRVCAAVAGGDGGQGLVPRDRGGLQRAIAQDVLRSSESLLRLAQERLRVGSGNEQAVAEARVSVGTYRDTLRQIELAREQALRALELLVGRYPSAEIAVAERLSPMPPPVPVGMPSQLLERRPDVIAAERRVAAAFNRVGEARAAQLPRISLTAGGSSVSSDLIELKDTSNPIWSFGGNLIAPLYQGGALRAQVEIRSAEQKQAVAEYARAGQRAFGEVEGALAAENALRERDADSRGHHPRQRPRAGARAHPVSRRRRRSARGRAEPARAVCRAHRRACACRPSASRSGSTCTSRSAAVSTCTCRRWPPCAGGGAVMPAWARRVPTLAGAHRPTIDTT